LEGGVDVKDETREAKNMDAKEFNAVESFAESLKEMMLMRSGKLPRPKEDWRDMLKRINEEAEAEEMVNDGNG
jgi:hypothetical protein